MLYLRQSTASQAVVIGPFVDSTDGNTAETALTVDAADIRLSKNGANIVGKNSGGGTHDELGYYTITLDATDTDTVGRLQLMVHESGALPVYHEFQVLEEAIFDGLFAASAARIPADMTAISGDTTAADNLENAFDDTAGPVRWQFISDQGTLQAVGSTSSVTLAATASAEDDVYNGQTIHFPTATLGSKQSTFVSDYNGTTKVATLSPALAVGLTGTVTYKVGATAAGTTPVSANVTQWNGSAVATPTVAGVPEVDVTHWIGTAAATPTVAGVPEVDVTHYLGSASPALVGGRFDVSVGAMAANVMTAAAAAADLTTELQSGLATAAALDTVDNLIDTEVAAIKTVVDAIQVKTDSLTFTVAGVVDANIQRINDVAITGDGSGTPFNV